MKRFILFVCTLGISEFFRKKESDIPKELVGLTDLSFSILPFFSPKEIEKSLKKLLGKNFEYVLDNIGPDGGSQNRRYLVENWGNVPTLIKMQRSQLDDDDMETYFHVYTRAKIKNPNDYSGIYLRNVEPLDSDGVNELIEKVRIYSYHVACKKSKDPIASSHLAVYGLLPKICHNCHSDPFNWARHTFHCSYCGVSLVHDRTSLEQVLFGREISFDEAVEISCLYRDGGPKEYSELCSSLGLKDRVTIPSPEVQASAG